MDLILNKIKQNALIIIMIALFSAAALHFITGCAGFPNKFFPVIGHMLSMALDLALLISIPLFLLLKNDKLAKIATFIYGGYWLISEIFTAFNATWMIQKDAGSGNIARGIFLFLIGLCLIASIVLFVLGRVKNDHTFVTIALIILCGTIVLFFIEFIINLVMFIKLESNWTSYFNGLAEYLLIPIGLLAATIRIAWVTKEESLDTIDVE